MWKELLNDGRVRYREHYKNPMTGMHSKVTVTFDKDTPKNAKKAKEELALRIKKKLEQVNMPTEKNTTLSELVNDYLAYQAKAIKKSTYDRNYSVLHSAESILGKNTLLSKLSARYISRQYLNSGKSNVTINEHFTRIKAMLRWAYKNDYINSQTIIDKLELLPDATASKKVSDKYLEPEEIQALLKFMKTDEAYRWYYLTQFLVLTGLRVGEAIALDKTDIDMEQKVIHVKYTYDSRNKVRTTPKTATSYRDVYIQPELADVITTYTAWHKRDELANNYSTNLFFSANNGDYCGYAAYAKCLKKASLAVLQRNITPHILRHTHASLLLAAGIPIETISRRLGHENSQITKEI
ncbi:MAG: tyrosine-type recombinase/integrase, partial [Coprococcus sp.]